MLRFWCGTVECGCSDEFFAISKKHLRLNEYAFILISLKAEKYVICQEKISGML